MRSSILPLLYFLQEWRARYYIGEKRCMRTFSARFYGFEVAKQKALAFISYIQVGATREDEENTSLFLTTAMFPFIHLLLLCGILRSRTDVYLQHLCGAVLL